MQGGCAPHRTCCVPMCPQPYARRMQSLVATSSSGGGVRSGRSAESGLGRGACATSHAAYGMAWASKTHAAADTMPGHEHMQRTCAAASQRCIHTASTRALLGHACMRLWPCMHARSRHSPLHALHDAAMHATTTHVCMEARASPSPCARRCPAPGPARSSRPRWACWAGECPACPPPRRCCMAPGCRRGSARARGSAPAA